MMKKHMTQEVAIKSAWMILEGLGYRERENRELAKTVEDVFDTAPAADVVEVVRCRDCKNYRPWGKVYERKDYTGLCIVWSNMSVHKEDYCSHAVRKSKEGGKKNGK